MGCDVVGAGRAGRAEYVVLFASVFVGAGVADVFCVWSGQRRGRGGAFEEDVRFAG